MNPQHRRWLVNGVLAVALVAAAGWSYSYLDDQRTAAIAASAEAAECERLSGEIQRVRTQNGDNTSDPVGQDDPISRIARAGTEAGIPEHGLDQIQPDHERASDTSAHRRERPTRFTLRHVALRAFGTMLQSLDRPAAGSRVTRVHLVAPEGAADEDAWTAEATLTDTLPGVSSRPATKAQ